jgi:hypothetical protein
MSRERHLGVERWRSATAGPPALGAVLIDKFSAKFKRRIHRRFGPALRVRRNASALEKDAQHALGIGQKVARHLEMLRIFIRDLRETV